MTCTIRPRTFAVALLFCAAATLPFAAEERINSDLNARIREEGMNKSQVMRTLHFLADVYGPRVTGSPSLKAAGEWAVKTMEGWGMTNGRLEPWAFGHPGWANELAWGAITAPVKDTLVLEVLAWTPGTKGAVKGTAVNIVIPEQPTPEELAAYFAGVKDRVKGAVVLVGPPRAVPVNITPACQAAAPTRTSRRRYDPNSPNYGRGRGGQRGGGRGQQAAKPGAIPARELGRRVDEFLVESGRARPDERRRPRARPDHRVQQQHVRHHQGGPDRRGAQRGLRPHRAHPGRRHAGRARVQHREQGVSGRADRLQHDRGDSGERQGGRSRDARRAPRFLALGHGRHGQRDRLRDHDGSGAHPEDARRRSRAGRSASRSGAERKKGCSARSRT